MASKRPLRVLDLNLPNINWNTCFLCQKATTETLINPTEGGLLSLAQDLKAFGMLSPLPRHLDSENLPIGMEGNTKYHKTCRAKFNNWKIDRLCNKKQRLDESSLQMRDADLKSSDTDCANKKNCSPESTNRLTRSHLSTADIKESCIFCDGQHNPVDKLVSVETLGIGPSIYENALLLQDTKLITKLTTNKDLVALGAKYHKRCYVHFLNSVRSLNRSHSKESTEDSAQKTAMGHKNF